jgi:hypothetical protein
MNAIGFSHNTCRPASTPAITIGWCRSTGMTTTSASSSLLSIIAR